VSELSSSFVSGTWTEPKRRRDEWCNGFSDSVKRCDSVRSKKATTNRTSECGTRVRSQQTRNAQFG